MVFIVLKL